jgi:hypothetical protein
LADTAETLFNFASSMWITGGQGSEQFFRALVPYVPLCNLLGSKIELGAVTLVPVLYADELPPAILEQRFEEFMDLAGPLTQFGPRLNLQAMGYATIFPLLIYFDSKKYSADLPEIIPDAWQKRIMRRIYLQATMVNVPDQQVEFAERKGFWSLGNKLTEAFGYKPQIFEPADIAAVIALGNEAT